MQTHDFGMYSDEGDMTVYIYQKNCQKMQFKYVLFSSPINQKIKEKQQTPEVHIIEIKHVSMVVC